MAQYHFRRYIRVLCGGVDVSNLRISFEYSNEANAEPSEGKVDIYNLSRKVHSIIEDNGTDIFVDAGYLEGAGVYRLFAAKVQRVVKTRVEHAFITRIHFTDAIAGAGNPLVNISENERYMPVREIARKIIGDVAKVRVGDMEAIPRDAVYPYFNATGSIKSSLEKLVEGTLGTDGQPIDVVVDGDVVHFRSGNRPIRQHNTIVKTPSTGLIGVPEEKEEGKATFQMLLEPRLRVAGAFEVQDSNYLPDSVYTINKVEHKGDNWTGKFISTIDCARAGFEPKIQSESGDAASNSTGFGSNTFEDRTDSNTTDTNIRE